MLKHGAGVKCMKNIQDYISLYDLEKDLFDSYLEEPEWIYCDEDLSFQTIIDVLEEKLIETKHYFKE